MNFRVNFVSYTYLILVMDIKSFFERKKRELSNQSEEEDIPKRARDSSLDRSIAEAEKECGTDVFAEGLKSEDCVVILCNCVQNLEKRMNEMCAMTEVTKASQIKGEQELVELNKSISAINEIFQEYQKDKKEKEEKINNLESKVTEMSNKIENLEKVIDDQEQYSRRNCLLIHGISETDGENTDELVLNTVQNNMEITLSPGDIDRTHRIGKKVSGKTRPIIVKLARYNMRHKIFVNKKRLKGKKISITESLTAARMKKLNEARDKMGFTNVWTSDGKILYKSPTDNSVKLFYG